MVYRDYLGNVLEENDVVMVPMGFGQLIQGVVLKTGGGLVAAGGQQQVPHIMVSITIPLNANPANGLVGGIIKVGQLDSPTVH